MFVTSRIPPVSLTPSTRSQRQLKRLFLTGVEGAFASGELPSRNHSWKAVFRAFIDMIGPGNQLYPSHAAIAEKAQVSERSVWAAMNHLEQAGFVRVTARYVYDHEKGKTVRTSNLYEIVTSRLQQAAAIVAAAARKSKEAMKRQAAATVRGIQKVFHHLTATDAEESRFNLFRPEHPEPERRQLTKNELLECLTRR